MHKEIADLINRNVQGANAVAFLAPDKKTDSSITVEASHIYKVIEFLKNNKENGWNSLHVISGLRPPAIKRSYLFPLGKPKGSFTGMALGSEVNEPK
jgi:uncharacterized protein YcbK (DUF882 family)